MVAGNRAKTSLFAMLLALLLVHPASGAQAYDQTTWDELTKKESLLLRTLRTRPLELPAKGKVTQKVVTYFDPQYAYGVYLPKDYDPRKPWPVVFFIPPSGFAWQYCMMYQTYAEQLGWILVAGYAVPKTQPAQPGQPGQPAQPVPFVMPTALTTADAIDCNIAVIKDVLARFNVHKEMCITAGFSSGGRIAGMLAFADKDFPWMMGTIQIGAAKGPLPPTGGKQVYLIAGKLDPNLAEVRSWEKSCREAGCTVEKVEWNAGPQMVSGPMFHQALKWHTDNFLKRSPDTSDTTQQKRQDYVANLIDVARRGDSGNKIVEIYVRYRAAHEAGSSIPCGLQMTKQAMALERRMEQLARYPEVKQEMDCYTELQALVERVERQEALQDQKIEEAEQPAPAPVADPAPPAAAVPPIDPPAALDADPQAVQTPPGPPSGGKSKPAANNDDALDDDDEFIPEDDDLLPEELARRKAAAKAEADAAKAKTEAAAKAAEAAKKQAEEEARLARIPVWDQATALAKKYPGTLSAQAALILAAEWRMRFQPLKIAKGQLLMYGNPLPPIEPWPSGRLQPALAENKQ